jgi:uncharacterized protein (DUF362 family)
MESLVSLVQSEIAENLRRDIRKSLDLINFQPPRNAHTVAVKPNLCYYWDYSTGETTDPRFVSAMIDVIRGSLAPQAEISIVESDASAMKCKYSFRMLGYGRLAAKKKVRLVNLTNDATQTQEVQVKNKNYEYPIPKTVLEADLFINVPKIKYMAGPKISCALKNIYGCNPAPEKYRCHRFINEAIVGLNKLMKPTLCIVDGLIARGIRTTKLGLVMASTDPVALDSAASEIAGINPNTVKHIILASQEGLGSTRYTIEGKPLEDFRKLFPRKTVGHKAKEILSKWYNRILASKS